MIITVGSREQMFQAIDEARAGLGRVLVGDRVSWVDRGFRTFGTVTDVYSDGGYGVADMFGHRFHVAAKEVSKQCA
jgi:hypothetical protein